MRKLLTAVFVLLLASTAATAQTDDTQDMQLFGGYSYLRADGSFHGFNVDFTKYVNEWLGITGAVGGNYASEGVSGFGLEVEANRSVHTFTVGPRVRFPLEDSPLTPFGHALFGVNRRSADVDANIPGLPTDIVDESATDFAMILGGGVDWRASDLFSIRLAQIDVVSTRVGETTVVGTENESGWTNNFRYSGGIVIRF